MISKVRLLRTHSQRVVSILLLALIVFTNCSDQNGTRRLPRHSGEPGEVLIVMPEKQWEGTLGDSLRAELQRFYPQLPQGEPSFSLIQFTPAQMSGMLKQHRNIIEITVGLDAEGRNKVAYEKDKWSDNQLVFKAYATDEDAFYELLKTDFPKIESLINQKEISRTQSHYKKFGNDALESTVQKKYGVSLYLPDDFKLAEDTNNFMWLRRERVKYMGNTAHEITQGLFLFTYPYTSDSALSEANALAMRDSILKMYVPGPKEGTYMTTEYRYPPSTEVIDLNGKYSLLTRGLWKTENYFMGGPFISLTTTSQDDRNIISISGFVFAPKFDKREYIREIESILKSVKISESTSK